MLNLIIYSNFVFKYPESRRLSHATLPLVPRRQSNVTQESSKQGRPESHHIGSNIRTKRNISNSTANSPQKKKDKKKDWKEKQKEEEGEGVDVIPIVGGVMIASVLGLPVVFIAGIKLGLFAAIGGGAMGYTTGKMFSDHG